MNPFRITLPTPLHQKRWSAPGTSLAVAFPALLLAFSPLPLAAQGGKKPGGGGGGDGVTVHPVIPLVSAPIGYHRVELRWESTIPEGDPNGVREDARPGYGGIQFNGINNQGVVVGSVGRPLAGYPDPYRTGVINVNPTTGELGASMFPLDQMFGPALGAINAVLAPDADDPKWRIAYGRSVTASGLVVCYLLPENKDKAVYGAADVPLLAAVGDLTRRTEIDALTLLTPADTGSTQWLVQLTESGHVLAMYPDGERLFHRNPQNGTYAEVILPTEVQTGLTTAGMSSGNNLSINDALELCFHEYVPVGTVTEARIVRYGAPNPVTLTYGAPTFPWQAKDLEAVAIAERNTTSGLSAFYAQLWQTVTTGKGRTAQTRRYSTPYHVHSATSRTPLTTSSENGKVHSIYWTLSDSPDGEEELLMRVEKEGAVTWQIYKPKLAARFVVSAFSFPSTQALGLVQVSPPHAAGQTSGTQYFGGYIGYGTLSSSSEPAQAFVLIPDGASLLQ